MKILIEIGTTETEQASQERVRRETVGCRRGDKAGQAKKMARITSWLCSRGVTFIQYCGWAEAAWWERGAYGRGARRRTPGQIGRLIEPHAEMFALDPISRFERAGEVFNPRIRFSNILMMTSLAAEGEVRQDWARLLPRNPIRNLGWESGQEVTKTPKARGRRKGGGPEAELR